MFRHVTLVSFVSVTLAMVFYGSFLTHKINLVTADLGRHIKNGEFLWRDARVITSNFYSYTEPDFPAANHHWLSGAAFFLFWRAFGFGGVQALFIAVSLAAFFIFFRIAQRHAGTGIAVMCALLVTPLLAERTEIRPEVFSYLFAAVFLRLFLEARFDPSKRRWLFMLPLAAVLWVNAHIYFFLGAAIAGVFWLEALLSPRLRHETFRRLSVVFGLTCLGTLVNPFGPKGALAPFLIFRNYGYRLIENQPVWFIEKLIANPNFLIFKIVFWLLTAVLLAAAGAKWWRWLGRKEAVSLAPWLPYFIFAVGLSAMAWLQIRNFAIFGFFAMPFFAAGIAEILPGVWRYRRELARVGVVLAGFMFLVTLSGRLQSLFPYWRQFGLGLETGNARAAEFFVRENLKGPVFNNYDIGGYLIFHLFPRERVFVDNRPEAYGVDFFEKTYIAMQESDQRWREVDGRYGFNALIFSHRDATPWGQKFLVSRIQDPQWAPVFADQQVLILLRRNETNRGTIERSELPKEMFKVL